MKIRPGKYDLVILVAAVAVWAYALSWIWDTNPFWAYMIHYGRKNQLSFDILRAIFGVLYLVVMAGTVIPLIVHFFVILVPSLRSRFKPSLLGHAAAVALFFLAFGQVVTVTSIPFPYIAGSDAQYSHKNSAK